MALTQDTLSGIPRRSRLDKQTPAELALREALLAVEKVGAHPLLTDAVVLISQAQDKVADFIDLVSIPDGNYLGQMSGFDVVIAAGGRELTLQAPFGVKGLNVPVEVAVRSNRVVEVREAPVAAQKPGVN